MYGYVHSSYCTTKEDKLNDIETHVIKTYCSYMSHNNMLLGTLNNLNIESEGKT